MYSTPETVLGVDGIGGAGGATCAADGAVWAGAGSAGRGCGGGSVMVGSVWTIFTSGSGGTKVCFGCTSGTSFGCGAGFSGSGEATNVTFTTCGMIACVTE